MVATPRSSFVCTCVSRGGPIILKFDSAFRGYKTRPRIDKRTFIARILIVRNCFRLWSDRK